MSNATAAAQEVYVTNPLSEWLDWTTFEMGEVAFNNQIDLGLSGKSGGTSEATMNGTNFIVRTTLTLEGGGRGATALPGDAGTRDAYPCQARWYLRIVDPTTDTGWPTDVLAGFLPPNDETFRGEGHLTYRIKVREDAPANVIITNSASIVFDYNDPIETDPAWWNTVGEETSNGHIVVLDAVCGTVGGAAAATQECAAAYGELLDAARDGHDFLGWFLGVTNGAPKAESGAPLLADCDHYLFAKWAVSAAAAPPGGTDAFTSAAADAETARITGFASSGLSASVLVLPDYVGGRAVTEVAPGAFANSKSGISEVVFPAFCTNIGAKAFIGVSSLKSAVFPGARRWDDPSRRADVHIGAYAFSGTGLSALVLPECVVSLGDYAFANCKGLLSVTVFGRPAIGVQPFRRSGNGTAGGVEVRIDPALASDAAYMDALVQQCGNVSVRTDAVVSAVSLTSLDVASGKVRLNVSVGKASSWGAIDADSVRVEYRESLGDTPVVLVPDSVTENGDGTLAVEVDLPEGASGFFRATVDK